MNANKLLLACLAGLTVAATGGAAAATLTAPMNVSAVVTGACSDLQATDLDFGSDAQLDGDDDQTANVLVTCAPGIAYTVEIDYGVNPAGTQRRVADAGLVEFMDYTIFQPNASGSAATTLPWGALADGDEYASVGTGSQQTLVASGRLSRASLSSPGTYTDLLIVTLNF